MATVKRALLLATVALVALAAAGPAASAAPPREVELVVALDAPPLAHAVAGSRALSLSVRRARLNLRTPTSRSHLRSLASAQRTLQTHIEDEIPGARVRWRYSVVLNALAVVVPAAEAGRLASLPGVRSVYPTTRYRALLDRGPRLIGAPALWGPSLATAGQGLKIGVIDDGIDQSHPFFSGADYAYPTGFPKGNRAFTTPKVIVARAFPPPSPKWANAAQPFDEALSGHATHVAGIAAGNPRTTPGGAEVSGVAPRAYLGNYKVLTIPTDSGVGLDGNSPEIAAGIEAAVRDGMDVINLSIGEPEIEPRRDLVVQAIDAAADAGVVATVAAGNDFQDFGRGSVGSPGSAAKAITVAAATNGRSGAAGLIAGFSASGPTPVSLQLKPDVTAPGANILSSVPARDGSWAVLSGTSMAAPHVAGAAALLRQRNPGWTVAQIKSALVATAQPVYRTEERLAEVETTRTGGGLVSLTRALNPLLFAEPTGVSFGLLRPGTAATRAVGLTDAGGGAGEWTVSLREQQPAQAVTFMVLPLVTVPGVLSVTATATAGAPETEVTGIIELSRGGESRRIPFWLRVAAPALARHRATPLRRGGSYSGNTRGRPSLVDTYAYPRDPTGAGVAARLDGPEQVFRVRIPGQVANFGVAILSRAPGVRVQARTVFAGDEDRGVGYTSLPLNLNPYLADFLEPRLASGAVRPLPGSYDIVFDSPDRAGAGRFRFRFWINDATPPTLRLRTPIVASGGSLVVSAVDSGSGVDPGSLVAEIDGESRSARIVGEGRINVVVGRLRPGRHSLILQSSDFQETRNQENVLRILPNTRRLSVAFRVR